MQKWRVSVVWRMKALAFITHWHTTNSWLSRLSSCRWYTPHHTTPHHTTPHHTTPHHTTPHHTTPHHTTPHDTSCRQGSSVAPPISDWSIYATELRRGHKLVFPVNMRWLEHSRQVLNKMAVWTVNTYLSSYFFDILVSEGYFYGEITMGKYLKCQTYAVMFALGISCRSSNLNQVFNHYEHY